MEFARHAEIIGVVERTHIGCRKRKMVIAPTARRQAFKLKMSVAFNETVVALRNVTAVMKNCCGIAILSYSSIGRRRVLIESHNRKFLTVIFVVYIQTKSFHIRNAFITVADLGGNDIKKYSARIIFLHNLLYLLTKEIKISCIEAKKMKVHFIFIFNLLILIGRANITPFRAFKEFFFIKTRRNINGSIYTDFSARFKLCTKQVKIKARVHFVNTRGMI